MFVGVLWVMSDFTLSGTLKLELLTERKLVADVDFALHHPHSLSQASIRNVCSPPVGQGSWLCSEHGIPTVLTLQALPREIFKPSRIGAGVSIMSEVGGSVVPLRPVAACRIDTKSISNH